MGWVYQQSCRQSSNRVASHSYDRATILVDNRLSLWDRYRLTENTMGLHTDRWFTQCRIYKWGAVFDKKKVGRVLAFTSFLHHFLLFSDALLYGCPCKKKNTILWSSVCLDRAKNAQKQKNYFSKCGSPKFVEARCSAE